MGRPAPPSGECGRNSLVKNGRTWFLHRWGVGERDCFQGPPFRLRTREEKTRSGDRAVVTLSRLVLAVFLLSAESPRAAGQRGVFFLLLASRLDILSLHPSTPLIPMCVQRSSLSSRGLHHREGCDRIQARPPRRARKTERLLEGAQLTLLCHQVTRNHGRWPNYQHL